MSEEKTYTIEEMTKAYHSTGPHIDNSSWLLILEKLQNPEPVKFECDVKWVKEAGYIHPRSVEYLKSIINNKKLLGKKGKLTFIEEDKK